MISRTGISEARLSFFSDKKASFLNKAMLSPGIHYAHWHENKHKNTENNIEYVNCNSKMTKLCFD